MPRKHYTSEEIIKLLRLVEIEVGKGKTIGQACKQQGFTEQSYYRWRSRGFCNDRHVHPPRDTASDLISAKSHAVGAGYSCAVLDRSNVLQRRMGWPEAPDDQYEHPCCRRDQRRLRVQHGADFF